MTDLDGLKRTIEDAAERASSPAINGVPDPHGRALLMDLAGIVGDLQRRVDEQGVEIRELKAGLIDCNNAFNAWEEG